VRSYEGRSVADRELAREVLKQSKSV